MRIDESRENIMNNINVLLQSFDPLLFLFSLLFKEPTLENLQRIAQNLAKRALRNGRDPNFYSPFARSAKRSLGINICGE